MKLDSAKYIIIPRRFDRSGLMLREVTSAVALYYYYYTTRSSILQASKNNPKNQLLDGIAK